MSIKLKICLGLMILIHCVNSILHKNGIRKFLGQKNTLKTCNSKLPLTTTNCRNSVTSTPAECARTCRKGQPPKTCYYTFNLEMYSTLGGYQTITKLTKGGQKACDLCTPNSTNWITPNCQCILADGVDRMIIAVNRMYPGPSIQVCLNDTVVVDVTNQIVGQDVTIHWHGMYQQGTQFNDGVPYVTQCPIPEGNTFRYIFKANPSGTHFWHSHVGLSKLDGIQGSLIVRQAVSEDASGQLYDFDLPEHIMFISDWMHELGNERFPGRSRRDTNQLPDNFLINGKGRFNGSIASIQAPLERFSVIQHKTYRFRLIFGLCLGCPVQFFIEGHNLTVIASDGVAVRPTVVNSIVAFSGERYDIVISTNQTIGSYWIRLIGLAGCEPLELQQLAILRYEGPPSVSLPPSFDDNPPTGIVLNPLNSNCTLENEICVSQLKRAVKLPKRMRKQEADLKLYLPYRFQQYNKEKLFTPNTYQTFLNPLGSFQTIPLINDISFSTPPSPLYSQMTDINQSVFCDRDQASCGDPCFCTHRILIPLNALVELILVDEIQIPNLSHPFHLHGQHFQVMGMGTPPDPDVISINATYAIDLDRKGRLPRLYNDPPSKDTITVPTNGYAILRFIADNPGFWFLHCHFLYHTVSGMSVVLQVGNLTDMPRVPNNFPKCGDYLPNF